MSRLISIVVPAYNEEENLPLLYKEIAAVLAVQKWSVEILFVDDCSTDTTARVIEELCALDERVQGIRLLHNTKKAGALAVGFSAAKGDILVTLDADLQDCPSEIPKLIAAIDDGADAVMGWRERRLDTWHKRLPSLLINSLSNFFFGAKFRDMNTGLKAYRKEAAEWIAFQGSLFRFIPHMLRAQGFRVDEVAVKHRTRAHGKSKFTVRHRLRSFFDLFTVLFISKFSDRPLHFFGGIGLITCGIGIVAGMYLTVEWFMGAGIGRRPLLQLVVLLELIGMQFMSVGLIGELMVHKWGNVAKQHPFRELGKKQDTAAIHKDRELATLS